MPSTPSLSSISPVSRFRRPDIVLFPVLSSSAPSPLAATAPDGGFHPTLPTCGGSCFAVPRIFPLFSPCSCCPPPRPCAARACVHSLVLLIEDLDLLARPQAVVPRAPASASHHPCFFCLLLGRLAGPCHPFDLGSPVSTPLRQFIAGAWTGVLDFCCSVFGEIPLLAPC